MFTVKVEKRIIRHCKTVLETHNFGNRFTANGTKDQQLTGIIGQSVVMSFFDLGLMDGLGGCDLGVDLIVNNKTIDVKTMGRTTDVKKSYTNNFIKLQDYFKTDIYIFCSYHKNKEELTVCGWIDKDTFITKRRYFPKGTIRTRTNQTTFTTFTDLFEIDNCHLNTVSNVLDLKKKLNHPLNFNKS
ncbi:hypothetical protein BZARG_1120 [Bizionia argentinensis JUB59]|uniref:Restriction endonuclease n=1 Tax=Bizionia argentinensis JUB59 TaxID=1046627 RepID=G2EEL8_9FLAO|nr:hypothetical protein [Bizionia argentinensis]EGV43161.1 hypothetical protein BZARG_1120 [Bizionia argentinensis JUB59]